MASVKGLVRVGSTRNAVLSRRTVITSNKLFSTSYQYQHRGSNNGGRQNNKSNTDSNFAGTAAAITLTVLGANMVYSAEKDKVDYNAVRKDIVASLEDEKWDDGSYGPLYIRLAWHASGTYDKMTKTGGSQGCTIRFDPEAKHGANAGLHHARDRLEKIKKKHPGIGYADLYTFAGVVALEEMGGPKINWKPGRIDHPDSKTCPPDGRLPDASKSQDHIRQIFYRMGFDDREIVALIGGGHALGRGHKDRSGYEGPWTRAPTTFSNEFFRLLLEDKWTQRKWNGPTQFENSKSGGDLMMLPTDMALVNDKEFRKYVELYAKNRDQFFNDFGKAFGKLLELGVRHPDGQSSLSDTSSSPKQKEKDSPSEGKSWWKKLFG